MSGGIDDALGKAYDARLMRRIAAFARRYPGLLVASLALLPVAMVFDLAQPKIMALAIDRAIAHGQLGRLPGFALAFLGVLVGQHVASFFQLYALQKLGQATARDLRVAVHAHLLRLRMAFFDRTQIGRLMTRVSSDVEAINEAFAAGLVTIVADFVRVAVILVILLRMDPFLTLVALGSAPLLAGIALAVRRTVRDAFRALRTRLAELNAFLQEHLSGMRIVQLFGREAQTARRFDERNARLREANLRAIRADAVTYALVEMIGAAAVAALLLASAGRVARGVLTIGVLVAFIQYIDRFFAPVKELSTKYTIMQQAMAAAERIFELLDLGELDGPAGQAARPLAAPTAAAALELGAVRFGYREGEPILAELSLRVERGQTVALVGSTGAGKSTLIKVLTRLYEPWSGTIELAGVDVRALPVEEVRRRIVVIPQDVFLFPGTLRENLTFGLQGASDERLHDALARVGADRVVSRRPGGLDHVVGERGSNFSAGEKQLLALARALVRDPEVLVLDEATANIDPETERLCERGVAELARGRSSIVIAHRLSTLARADRIAVLSHGRIAEQGSHGELLARGGMYAKLYRLHVGAAAAPVVAPAAAG
jgi:ATP-binding cassette subfamily B protein